MSELTSKDYQAAILVENASNIKDIINKLMEIMPRIYADTKSDDQRNNHPITKMFVSHLANLVDIRHEWDESLQEAERSCHFRSYDTAPAPMSLEER